MADIGHFGHALETLVGVSILSEEPTCKGEERLVHIVGWNTAGNTIDVGSRHAPTLPNRLIMPRLKRFDVNVSSLRLTGIRWMIPELDRRIEILRIVWPSREKREAITHKTNNPKHIPATVPREFYPLRDQKRLKSPLAGVQGTRSSKANCRPGTWVHIYGNQRR